MACIMVNKISKPKIFYILTFANNLSAQLCVSNIFKAELSVKVNKYIDPLKN